MKTSPVRPDPRHGFGRRVLLLTTALHAVPLLATPMIASAQPAPNTRPQGGQVVAGQAGIAQTQALTSVNQQSQRAAIDWKSFDIGAAHTVQYAQPNASAVTLNRVIGPNPSEIAGRIQANGQVVIVNQAGVLFHKGAQIDTAGLVATASGISNGNFMAGRMVFDQKANPGAKVENHGTITIRDRGLAALVAPQVVNAGVIRANMGTVMLAGAEAHTLDLYGDGMVGINVTRQVRSAPDGTKALVTNTGTIAAAGGSVVLTAEAVDGVVQTLVNAGGHISANTAGGRTGRIVASGRGGDVIVTGMMAANGTDPGTTGGTITVQTTGTIALGTQARISASGRAGGGTIALGTTERRATGGSKIIGEPTARTVLVSRGARIEANATEAGSGGIVTVLSADVTRMEGAIAARGVSKGGFVEVSGRRVSSAAGQIDVSATSGSRGTILIDPEFLDIVSGASGSGSQDSFVADGTILAGDGSVPPDTISTGMLNSLIGDVLLQANQTISVKGNLSLTNTAGQSLVLEAGGTITVDPGVTVTAAGNVILATGGAGPDSPPPAGVAPLVSVQGTVISNTGTVSLLAGTAGSITVGGAIGASAIVMDAPAGIAMTGNAAIGKAGAIVEFRSSAGGLVQDATAKVTAAEVRAPNGVAGSVTLNGLNAIDAVGSFAVTGVDGNFILINGGSVTVTGPLSATNNIGIGTSSNGRVTIDGTITNATGALAVLTGTGGIVLTPNAVVPISRVGLTAQGTIRLDAGARLGTVGALVDLATTAGGVSQDAAAIITAGTLRSTAGITGDVLLPGANNIRTLGTMAVTAGRFELNTAGGLSVNSLVRASDVSIAASALDITGRIDATTGTVSVVASAGTITQAGTIDGFAGVSLLGGQGISHTGTTTAQGTASSKVELVAVAGEVANTGTITAASDITAQAAVSTLRQSGTLDAGGAISLTGQDVVQSAGLIRAAGTVGINAGGTISQTGGTIIAGSDATLTGTAGVTLAGSVGAGGTAALAASAGAITLDAGGVVTGPVVSLAAAGSIALNAGTVVAGSVATLSGGGSIALNAGAVVSGPLVTVAAGGSIALAAGASLGLAGAGLDLSAGAGITQDAGASILGATLTSASGVTGGVSLLGSANAIGTIGAFAVTGGDFALTATGGVMVDGPLSASGAIGLTAGTIGVGGTIAAGTTLTFNASAGGIGLDAGAVATASVVDLTGASISVGGTVTAGTALALTATTGGISLNTGAVASGPAIGVSAGGGVAIAAGATLGQAGATITAAAGAGITQDPAGVIIARLFRAPAVTGDASLTGTANDIAELGPVTISGPGASLSLTDGGDLLVSGPITAPGAITFSHGGTGTMTVAALIDAGGSLSVAAGNGGLAMTATGTLTAPAILLQTRGALSMAAGARLGTAGAVVDVNTGGVAQDAGASLIAGTLLASTGITGTARFAGTANAIGTISVLPVSGGDLILVDTGGLTVDGAVSATGAASINTSGALAFTGSGRLTAPSVTLSAAGPISLDTGAVLGAIGALVDLSTSAGGITQQAGATILAATLLSSAGVTGSVGLAGTANAITTLGPFAVGGADADLVLTDSGALTITGPISATRDIRLDVAAGMTVAGSISATRDIQLDVAGGMTVTGPISATRDIRVAAATLTVAGSVSATRDISLAAAGVTIAASVQAGSALALTSTAGVRLNGGGVLAAPLVTVAAAGPIDLAAGAVMGQTGGVIDLSTSAGGIAQDAGASLIATTLRSTSGVTGDVSLAGSANAVGTIAAFGVSGGGFSLVDSQDLTITGPLTASGVIALRSAGQTQVLGSIAAGTSLSVTSAGAIAVGGSGVVDAPAIGLFAGGPMSFAAGSRIGSAGTVLDIATTAGGVSQDAGGTIIAASLVSSGGIAGDLTLIGANTITAIGALSATGAVRLHDTTALTLTGMLTSGSDAYLRVTHSGGITIAAGGGVVTAPSGRAGFQAPSMRILAGGTVATGAFEFAPATTGATITLGTGSGGLDTLIGVSATQATIGAITIPISGFEVTAGSIVAAAAFDANNLPLHLLSLGGIDATAAPLTRVPLLTGSAGATVDLSHAGNAIAALGAFAVAGTTADLLVRTSAAMTVTGPVTATRDVRLTTGADADLRGTIQAGRTIGVNASGAIITATADLIAPSVSLGATTSITLGATTTLGQAGATVDLSTAIGGVSQDKSGRIIAGRLASATGIAGDLNLSSEANAIGTIAAIAAVGAIQIVSLGDGMIAGPVSAGGDITLRYGASTTIAGTIAAVGTATILSGSIAALAGAVLTGPSIALDATGAISLDAGSTIGLAGSAVTLNAGGAIGQSAGGTLIADHLTARAAGSITLIGTANEIATVGTVSALGVGADIALVLATATRIEGPVTASDSFSLSAASLAVAGTISAGGSAALTARSGGLAFETAATLTAPVITLSGAGAITMAAGVLIGQFGAAIDIGTTKGGIAQDAGARMVAASLRSSSGVTGEVALPGSLNAISALDDFVVSGGGFHLTDTLASLSVRGAVSADVVGISAASLSVSGQIEASSGGIDLTSAAKLISSGMIRARDDVAIAAGGSILHLAGTVAAGGTATVSAPAGAIVLDGLLTAETGPITVGAGTSITLSGGVTATGNDIDLRAGGDISQTAGTLGAAGRLVMSAGGLVSLSGVADAGLDISVTAGTGLVLAGTMRTLDGGIALTSAAALEQIAGSLVSSTSLALQAQGSIAIGGAMTAATAFTANTGAGSFTLTGTVAATSINVLSGTDIGVSASGAALAGTSLAMTAGAAITSAGAVLSGAGGLAMTAGADLTQTGGVIGATAAVRLAAGATLTQIGGTILGVENGAAGGGPIELAASTITQRAGALIQAADAGGSIRATASGTIRTDGALIARDTAAGTIVLTANGASPDGFPLIVNGQVTAGFGVSATAIAGSISFGSEMTTGRGGLTVATARDLYQTGGAITLPVGFSVSTPGSFVQQGGTLRAPTLSITAQGGDIVQSQGGALLSADAGGRADLTASGRIDLSGLITANDSALGDVTLTAGNGAGAPTIAQNGTILAGRLVRMIAAAGDITHGGTTIADTITIDPIQGGWAQTAGLLQTRLSPVSVTASGTIRQDAGAILVAPGAITLTAGAGIDQHGILTSPAGTVTFLTTGGALTATGAITAGTVRFTNQAGQITVAGRIDGLTPSRLQSASRFAVSAVDFPTLADPAGVFITTGPGIGGQSISFTADIAATSGRGQLLISIPNDSPLSLRTESRNADLFLSLGTGSASGLLRVGSLHVRYKAKGTDETVSFNGTVNGLSGYTAASGSFILPFLLPNYQLNGCAIQSTNCFQISDLRVPVTNPLKDVATGGGSTGGSAQFALPDVAERDY